MSLLTKEEIIAKQLGWEQFQDGSVVCLTSDIVKAMELYENQFTSRIKELEEEIDDHICLFKTIFPELEAGTLSQIIIEKIISNK